MKQRWTYRFYPTLEQERSLAQTFGCVRYVYNWALEERAKALKEGRSMGYAATDRALTTLKRQPAVAWLNEVSSVPLKQALRDLQMAYAAFFAKRSAFPRFKRKCGRATARYTRTAFRMVDSRTLKVAKIGLLRLRWDRTLPSDPSSITIIREASGRYFVSFVVEVGRPKAIPMTGVSVGIDFGLSHLATLSTGEKVENPKYMRVYTERLALLQRRASKKQAGSTRRELANRAVARCHEKVMNCRKDTLNKFTTRLVTEFDTLYVEDLNLRGMVKNHNFARSLSDAGIGIAVRMLEKKAEQCGKRVIRIDRWFPSSKRCSSCKHTVSELPLNMREWTCPSCGTSHDRDLNAAKNILAVGQTVAAHGGGVRAA